MFEIMHKTKRKIAKKTVVICGAAVLAAVFSVVVFLLLRMGADRREKAEAIVFEAMVQTKGQDEYETPEDKAAFFENGDVIVIFPEGHKWTDSEREKLIVKIKISENQANQLMESEVAEIDREKAGSSSEEKEEEKPDKKLPIIEHQRKIIRMRKRRINLGDIGWNSKKPISEQNYGNKVFDERIIEEK